ncbi:hypothetical protein RBSH_05812 [Rhodopirellula baltica SH28]|uniref:Uncharacterized protein n=1 Tax=Rhodopirellula baltica SH28 TaxID=993517 RepID=K5CXS9_RHOBT|nr:hypothetical protein RBSH_05812 [Rhodopirellula baltica SH28]
MMKRSSDHHLETPRHIVPKTTDHRRKTLSKVVIATGRDEAGTLADQVRINGGT